MRRIYVSMKSISMATRARTHIHIQSNTGQNILRVRTMPFISVVNTSGFCILRLDVLDSARCEKRGHTFFHTDFSPLKANILSQGDLMHAFISIFISPENSIHSLQNRFFFLRRVWIFGWCDFFVHVNVRRWKETHFNTTLPNLPCASIYSIIAFYMKTSEWDVHTYTLCVPKKNPNQND